MALLIQVLGVGFWVLAQLLVLQARAAESCEHPKHNFLQIRKIEKFRCEAEFAAHGCNELKQEFQKKSPELLANLRDCSANEDSFEDDGWTEAKAMARGCGHGVSEDAKSSVKAVGESVASWFKDTVLCTEERKKQIYEEYNASVTNEKDQLPMPDGKKLVMYDCDMIRTEINRELLFKGVKRLTSVSLTQRLSEAEHFLREIGIKRECYRPEIKGEFYCTAAFALGSTVAGGAVVSRAAALMRLSKLAGSEKVVAAVNSLNKEGKVALEVASELSNFERVEVAKKLLKTQSLSWEQQQALIRAHEVGAGKSGYFTYTREELAEKMRILKGGGFSAEQSDLLMRNGLAGEFNLRAAVESLGQAAKKNADGSFSVGKYHDDRAKFLDQLKDYEEGIRTGTVDTRLNNYRLLSEMAGRVGNANLRKGFLTKYYEDTQKALKSDSNFLQKLGLHSDFATAAAAAGDEAATRAAVRADAWARYQGQHMSKPEDYAEAMARSWLSSRSADPFEQLLVLRQRKAYIQEFFGNGNNGWAHQLQGVEREIARLESKVGK